MTINIGVRSSIARGAESSIKDVPLQVAQHHTLGGEVVVGDSAGLNEKTVIDSGRDISPRPHHKTGLAQLLVEVK
jgi:hypothetical protein